MKKCAVLACVLLLTCLCTLQSAGQEPPCPIRVRVTEIPVDVTAVDKNGRPVTDLAQTEFVVLENGVEQPILHFAPVSYGPDAPQRPSFPTAIRPPEHRTFLIFVGRGRHYRVGAVQKLVYFVKDQLAPSDRVAVMAYNRASDFTTDHQLAARVLEKYGQMSRDIETALTTKNTGLAAVYGRKSLLKPFQARIDEIFAESGAASRRLVPDGGAGQPTREKRDRTTLSESAQADSRDFANAQREALRRREERQEQTAGGDAAEGGGGQVKAPPEPEANFDRMQLDLITDGLPFDDFIGARSVTEQDVEQLYAAISYLRFMEGEKHLIYLSEDGLALPSLQDDRGLGRIASDARVRIHTIQTAADYITGAPIDFDASYDSNAENYRRGARPPRENSTGARLRGFSMQSVQNVSNITGGTCFLRADIGRALEATDRMTRFFYLLGYVPSNRQVDESFRRIEVRVKRPGVRLYYRSGYFARDEWKAAYDREEIMTYARTAAALGFEGQLEDVKFTLQATRDNSRIRVVARLRPSPDVFQHEVDMDRGKLHASYLVVSKKGQVLAQTSDDVIMTLSRQTYDKVMQEGLALTKDFAVEDTGGDLQVKLIVYDPKNDRLGVGVAKVK